MPKKRKPRGPRRKRMRRPARLLAARAWLPTYPGKNVVRGYAKWFAVDHLCAVRELQMLGVALDPEYVEALKRTARNRPPKPKRAASPAEGDLAWGTYGIDYDDTFAFIAGWTEGGAAFGTTWEEAEQNAACDAPLGNVEADWTARAFEEVCGARELLDDELDDLPF